MGAFRPESSCLLTPFPDSATQNTPLAPSVEKAYYRKCIALKRRLNEIETANDEAKIRRVRLDRAIMKMRLERAFLLDELRRRMDHKVDDSEGSGEEAMATPPPDRPHRDKRRRHTPTQSANASPSSHQATLAAAPSKRQATSETRSARATSRASDSKDKGSAGTSNPGKDRKGDADSHAHMSESGGSASAQPRSGNKVGAAGAAVGNGTNLDSDGGQTDVNGRNGKPVNRNAGTTGEPLSSGPVITEDANAERRLADADSSGDPMNGVEGPA